jgi:CubicO group peptidase (beta-lactamase class C family)
VRAQLGSLIVAAALALLLLVAPGPPTGPGSPLDRFVREADFAGAVLVAHGGRVLLSAGYGDADILRHAPNTPRTPFRIGSVGKQFTAAAILLLQERGRLRVEDPVCEYVDDCPAAWRPITLHHLLTHTSGLIDLFDLPEVRQTGGRKRSVAELVG